jgi:hypothetical protein
MMSKCTSRLCIQRPVVALSTEFNSTMELDELTSSMKNPINLAFVQQLRMLSLDGFELDRHFFSCGHVCSQVNITEGTATDLAAKPVLLSHSQLHTCVAIKRSTSVFLFRWIGLFAFCLLCRESMYTLSAIRCRLLFSLQ